MLRASIAVLLFFATPALAYDPCLGPRQAAGEVEATRAGEAAQRKAWEAAGKVATLPNPRNRDAELGADYTTKKAVLDACEAAANAAPQSP